LTERWEAKFQRLHPKLHPKNQTTKKKAWRVKVKAKEELFAFATKGEMIVQRTIVVVNAIHNHEKDDKVMAKATPAQLSSSILQ
jgi:hypothetical protein